jgi:protein SCO1/2
VLLLTATPAFARQQSPLAQATLVEHVGAPVPADARFTDDTGHAVTLGSFMRDRTPVILDLAYFSCPMLCPMVFDGLADAIATSGLQVGRDVRVVTISIDPHDTTATAAQWRARAAGRLHGDAHTIDWHVLTGGAADIGRVSQAVGFAYGFDPESGQYAHPAALFVLTPDGRVSRYLYGFTFDPDAVAAAVRAAAGRGEDHTPIERLLIRCFHYVPSLRRHGGAVTWLLRTGGAAVIGLVGCLLFVMVRRDRSRSAR